MGEASECPSDCMCGACTCSMCGSTAYDCDGQCTSQYEEVPETESAPPAPVVWRTVVAQPFVCFADDEDLSDAQQVSATPSSGPPPR